MSLFKSNKKSRVWRKLAVTLLVMVGVFCGINVVEARPDISTLGGFTSGGWLVQQYISGTNDVAMAEIRNAIISRPNDWYYISSMEAGNVDNGAGFFIDTTQSAVVAIQISDFNAFMSDFGQSVSLDKSQYNIWDNQKKADLAKKFVTDRAAIIAKGKADKEAQAKNIDINKAAVGTVKEFLGDGSDGARNAIGTMVAWVLYYIASGLGAIMVLVAKVMLTVAAFNNFIGQGPVQAGWAILRDMCNNFFIIFMLIMAGGIALNLQNYSLKSMLPKILTAAILINFSLMFTGILIDISQILTLTFAGPLANSTGYGLILKAMGLPDAYSMGNLLTTESTTIGTWDVVVALLFAVIVTIVAIVVIGVIAVILVYRIVMLMFLAVLSPLPVLAGASNIKGLSLISSEWESKLSKMLTVGPAMMFFLYLSFLFFATPMEDMDPTMNTAEQIQTQQEIEKGRTASDAVAKTTNIVGVDAKAYSDISGMGSVSGLLKFALTIGFLVVSLMMGQRFGDGAAKYASGAQGWLTKQGKKFSGFNLAGAGLKKVQEVPGKAIAKVGTGALGITSATTKGLGNITGSTGLQKLGAVGSQWRADVLDSRRKARAKSLSAMLGKVGLSSDEAKEKWGEFTNTGLAKGIKTVGTGAAGLAVGGVTAWATGGASLLIPAAAAYFGGGGRLTEIGLGKWGSTRAKNNEAKQKKIDDIKKETDLDISRSEAQREAAINSNTAVVAAKTDLDQDQKELDQIDDLKTKNGKVQKMKNGNKQIPDDFYDFLQGSGGGKVWMNANNVIKDDELEKAKEAFKKEQAYKDRIINRDAKAQTYETALATARPTEEGYHHSRVNQELDRRYRAAKTKGDKKLLANESIRYNQEYMAKNILKSETEAIEAALQGVLSGIDLDPTKNVFQKVKEKAEAEENAKKAKNVAAEKFSKTVAEAQHQGPKPRAIDTILDDYKPYAHPNWVSQAVAVEATKNQKQINDLISAIKDAGADVLEGFHQLDKGKFYSQSGQTELQFKTFKKLTDSTADSTKAITSLIDSLTAMGTKVDGEQAQLVKELKQGIAAYKKGGGDVSKLTAVITLLDQKTGTGKNGKVIDDKTVAQYETDIKTKK